MKQIMIIDVQKTFEESSNIVEDIIEYSSKSDNVIYLYDIVSGEGEGFHDMWEEMLYAHEEGKFNPQHILTKEYAFFRNLMDENYPDEFIVDLGKLMISNNIHDAREFYECESEIFDKFKTLCKNHDVEEPDFDSLTFSISDLKTDLCGKVLNGVILVGGARNECLAEVALLLDMMDIEYTINESLCY
jgi:hypothetical protein